MSATSSPADWIRARPDEQRAGGDQPPAGTASPPGSPLAQHEHEVPRDHLSHAPGPAAASDSTRGCSAAAGGPRRRSCWVRAQRRPSATVTANSDSPNLFFGSCPCRRGVAAARAAATEVVPGRGLVPAPRAEPGRVADEDQAARPGDPDHLLRHEPRVGHVLEHVGGVADVDRAGRRTAAACRSR